jgi:hypothetical protein
MGTSSDLPLSSRRLVRRRRLERLAWAQAGILSRRQLYAAGATRAEVRANVRAERWRRVGRQSVCVHRGPLDQAARHWISVFEAGPRAHLDGGSSLIAAGLQHFAMERVRVSVPRGARVWRSAGLDIRQTRRWDADEVVRDPVPRTRNPVAAVRHAIWARSNKEAALVLALTVQQGLATAEELGEAMLKVRRDKRRGFIHAVILDLMGGATSLGELDVAAECRRRGYPEPNRQVLRRGPRGKYYLDVTWDEWGVVVEIDGIQHSWAQNIVHDAVRHNDIALTRKVVLRVPLLGLRLDADTFYAQIEQALRDGGWTGLPVSA